MTIQKLVRKNILDLVPYSAARYEFNGRNATLLDANENPHGGIYSRYPDPWQTDLKISVSKIKGISTENIFIGNGADEAIDLLIRAFCEPGVDSVLVNDPTYSMYEVSAQINGNKTIRVPLYPDFSLNAENVLDVVEPESKLIFLCSPVNPSGNLLDKYEVRKIIGSFSGLVVIDEAYIDFNDDKGFLPLLNKYENLVVLHTFSKARALAGIRLGLALANKGVIDVLNKIKPPYNISGPAQRIALEALEDPEGFNRMVKKIKEQRDILIDFLKRYELCDKVFPTDANFVLARFNDANTIYDFLKKESVIVRNRSRETHCENCLRITIGTEAEIRQLIDLLLKYEKEVALY